MKIFRVGDKNFRKQFERVISRGKEGLEAVERSVHTILEEVKAKGDEAVIEYTRRFDGINLLPSQLRVSREEIEEAYEKVPKEDLDSLKLASERIESFHRRQLMNSWFESTENGIILGQMVIPLKRIGAYIPGGENPYPSTVLMTLIPAKIAGVSELIMVSPIYGSRESAHVIAAAELSGATAIFRVGGAQAVGALAYGTDSVPKVDKIVGPGNVYVATAKRMVFGEVGVDMVAGPSEICIFSDGHAPPSSVAADLLSQGEHDERALLVLIVLSDAYASAVNGEVERQVKELKNRAVVERSLSNQGAIIVAQGFGEAIDLINEIAPEHLELIVETPWNLVGRVRNAGAIFLGPFTPETVGDYLAGTNHVLPTGGTSRFSSPLGVDDFLKKSNIISFSQEALSRFREHIIRMAAMEGLDAHARAVEIRFLDKKV
ncbi:MAG: histidinol dehydrogenase [Syntrophobacterales bacterium]|nr:MAG: histidinol dehydrogenase [Syntrophobacterales bacterium]